MVAPIVAAASISAASVLVQAYMQERQRGADKKRLDEFRRAFDALTPPDLSIDDEDVMERLERYNMDPVSIPELEWSKFTPGTWDLIQKYVPEVSPYIAEKVPEKVKRSAVGEEGLSAQRKALDRLMAISDASEDPRLMQQLQQAERQAQSAAQSRQESILQDMARRGTLGSGQELAMQMAGSADAMDRAAMMSQDAASQAYQNRLNAMMSGAEIGRGMEATDINLQGRNVDIINDFNRRTSKAYQDYLQRAADTRNRAQLENIGNQMEGISQKDAASKWGYNTQVAERDWKNKMIRQAGEDIKGERKDTWDMQTQKIQGKMGVPQAPSPWTPWSTMAQAGADTAQTMASAYYGDQARRQREGDTMALEVYKKTGKWPDKYTPPWKDDDYDYTERLYD